MTAENANTFTVARPIQACVDEFTARNQMPTAQRFGLWVDVTPVTPDAEYVILCRLVFGKGNIRRVADVEARLVKLTENSTQISMRVAGFNWAMGTVVAALGLIGALFVLVSTANNTSGALCLLAIFGAMGVFGAVLVRTQYRDAQRLPAAIRDWFDAAPDGEN